MEMPQDNTKAALLLLQQPLVQIRDTYKALYARSLITLTLLAHRSQEPALNQTEAYGHPPSHLAEPGLSKHSV